MGCSSSTAAVTSNTAPAPSQPLKFGPNGSVNSADGGTGGNPSDSLRKPLPIPDVGAGDGTRAGGGGGGDAHVDGAQDPSTPPAHVSVDGPEQFPSSALSPSSSSALSQQTSSPKAGHAAPLQPQQTVSDAPPQATTETSAETTTTAGGTGRAARKRLSRKERAKTAQRRAQTASRGRERKSLSQSERRDHLQRASLDRFRDAVKRLQSNPSLMGRLRRESQAVQEAELDALCFSLDDPEPDPEPEGPMPTMEEYLERLRSTKPVAE